jgi:uncharacterized protein
MIHRTWRRALDDGAHLVADVRIPDGPPPRTAVVVVHGFKGFKDWGFFPHACESLAADGHAVVSFNFSLNGIGSDPLEFTELDAFARNTFTRELKELHLVLEALFDGELLPLPPRRIGVLGHSRGGGSAVIAASESARVDALVTWASVATFDRWDDETRKEWRADGRIHVLNARTGQQLPLDVTLLEDLEGNRERLDVTAAASRVRAPWLILHGEEDASVSPEEARLLARAGPSARLHLVEGAGHTFEAGHPFQGETPELAEALRFTRAHFLLHLLREGDS